MDKLFWVSENKAINLNNLSNIYTRTWTALKDNQENYCISYIMNNGDVIDTSTADKKIWEGILTLLTNYSDKENILNGNISK